MILQLFSYSDLVSILKEMHQIDINNVLNNTIIKVFIIYQLIQFIIFELSKYKSKLVIKMEELFLLDSQIDQR